jgi:hypothetical protein
MGPCIVVTLGNHNSSYSIWYCLGKPHDTLIRNDDMSNHAAVAAARYIAFPEVWVQLAAYTVGRADCDKPYPLLLQVLVSSEHFHGFSKSSSSSTHKTFAVDVNAVFSWYSKEIVISRYCNICATPQLLYSSDRIIQHGVQHGVQHGHQQIIMLKIAVDGIIPLERAEHSGDAECSCVSASLCEKSERCKSCACTFWLRRARWFPFSFLSTFQCCKKVGNYGIGNRRLHGFPEGSSPLLYCVCA